jgi:hypothetical protein
MICNGLPSKKKTESAKLKVCDACWAKRVLKRKNVKVSNGINFFILSLFNWVKVYLIE